VEPLADVDPLICNHLHDASVASNVQTSKKKKFSLSLRRLPPSEDPLPQKTPSRRKLPPEKDSLLKKTPSRKRLLPEENSFPPEEDSLPPEEDSLPSEED